jgi:hypothetical protein
MTTIIVVGMISLLIGTFILLLWPEEMKEIEWQYRVGTYGANTVLTTGENRLFCVVEVLARGKDVINIGRRYPTDMWATLEELGQACDGISTAWNYPIVDLDNFPNNWKNDTV